MSITAYTWLPAYAWHLLGIPGSKPNAAQLYAHADWRSKPVAYSLDGVGEPNNLPTLIWRGQSCKRPGFQRFQMAWSSRVICLITTSEDPAHHQVNAGDAIPCVPQLPLWETRFNTAFDVVCTVFWACIEAQQLQWEPPPGGTSSVDLTHLSSSEPRAWMDIESISHPQPCEHAGDGGFLQGNGLATEDGEPRGEEAYRGLTFQPRRVSQRSRHAAMLAWMLWGIPDHGLMKVVSINTTCQHEIPDSGIPDVVLAETELQTVSVSFCHSLLSCFFSVLSF
ncbi:Hypothetical predicted protein [Pelobates cultripes]|uniref:Uncharacterized protein n=1 Tax=Pelobates cultripes TaxID=61616 RepID=A0AAD1RFM1_PELCU|nr:Hypothetical predicted protein [Pelobates cultripes]